MTDTALLADRVRGCFLGVALGDAMGMPGELWPRAQVLAHFGRIDRFLPGPDGHFVVDGYRAGQITDDTQQTLMLAGAIVAEDGDVVPETVARHLVAWADRVGASEGNFLGPSSARAIDALRRGVSPWDVEMRGETNGAAMRIAPVGLVSRVDDLEDLVDRVEASALMSHATDVALAGAAVIAGAVSAALDAAGTGAERLDAVVRAALEAGDVGARRGTPVVAPSMRRRVELAVGIARGPLDDDAFLAEVYELVGASVAAIDTVPAAMALVVRAGGDPVRSALLAANLGGDTDTIGAVAGGVCGAFSGASAIPDAYLSVLRAENDLELDPLVAAFVGFRERTFRRNRPGVLRRPEER
ncbi:ADP-ribosylglycohydrolase family protein [Pseudolysinimonas sp.]